MDCSSIAQAPLPRPRRSLGPRGHIARVSGRRPVCSRCWSQSTSTSAAGRRCSRGGQLFCGCLCGRTPLGNIQADIALHCAGADDLGPGRLPDAPALCLSLGRLRAGITSGSLLCMLTHSGLHRAAPRFAKVSADHVTLAYKPSVADVARRWAAHLGAGVELTVVGEVVGDDVQVRGLHAQVSATLHQAILQVMAACLASCRTM